MNGLMVQELNIGGINKKNNNMIKVYLLMFVIVALISYFWAKGIDSSKENYPDYKGEDFLDLDLTEEDKKDIL